MVFASLLAATVLAGGRTDERKAMDLLARSMRGSFKVNVVAIIHQRDSASGGYQQVKLMRSKSGKQRVTVLAPLRVANIESVDDGERQRTYLPDEKVVIDQPSPLRYGNDVSQRIDLTRRNYTIQLMPKRQIAGRVALCVAATPKNPEMDVRRFYLDEETGYPLRIETIGDSGEPRVMLEAKAVDYPKELDGDLFKMVSRPGATTVPYSRPKSLSRKEAQGVVGFSPLIPTGLPMGFKVQQMQYSGSKNWQAVAIHLTDGLARAIVYEMRSDGTPVKVMGDSTERDVNGIRVILVSELGPKVRLKLLNAYISQVTREEP